jgi:hypothetical protein
MSKLYVYQIKGILEKPNKDIGGMRVLLCSKDFFDSVDVPSAIFDRETLRYLKFRLQVNEYIDVRKLPISIQNRIRTPMNQWLDNWVIREKSLGNSE